MADVLKNYPDGAERFDAKASQLQFLNEGRGLRNAVTDALIGVYDSPLRRVRVPVEVVREASRSSTIVMQPRKEVRVAQPQAVARR